MGSAAGLSLLDCLPFHVPLHNQDNWDMMIWAGFSLGHPCVVHWGGLSSWSVCLFDWGVLLWAGVSGVCIFGDFSILVLFTCFSGVWHWPSINGLCFPPGWVWYIEEFPLLSSPLRVISGCWVWALFPFRFLLCALGGGGNIWVGRRRYVINCVILWL